MGVPEEIRRVKRPTNTIVVENKTDGPHKYAVRERKGMKYVPGGNPQPVNGKVIGHIFDGRFVPLVEKTAPEGPEELSYGSSALVRRHSKDILDDLLSTFEIDDALSIMAAAGVKVIRPRTTYNRISQHHRRTFLSVYFPASVGRNRMSKLLEDIGIDAEKRRKFFRLRAGRVLKGHHVLVDGHLKEDHSRVNDLSHYSRNRRTSKHREVSIIYAYDLEQREVLAAQVFPGNCLDSQAYRRFLTDNGITKGILVADKGFTTAKIRDVLGEYPELSHISPLKRNSDMIKRYGMLDFQGALKGSDSRILYKKAERSDGRFLYSFKDLSLVSEQAEKVVAGMERGRGFNREVFDAKYAKAGVLIFESDLDVEPEVVYAAYDERWEIELVFDQFNNNLQLGETHVQGDFSVIGSEFINTIATMVSHRIMNDMRDAGVLDHMTYGDAMEDLSEVWRRTDAPGDPVSDDGFWTRTFDKDMELMEALGLSEPAPKPLPKKRGRPRKNPGTNTDAQ